MAIVSSRGRLADRGISRWGEASFRPEIPSLRYRSPRDDGRGATGGVWPSDGVKTFYVYILGSRSGVSYTGVTNDLERRVWEHKEKALPSFTAKYHCDRLVYYEQFPDSWSAIEAEKKIKGWRREKKVNLIEEMNPAWRDLSEGWYDDAAAATRGPSGHANRHPEGSGSEEKDCGME